MATRFWLADSTTNIGTTPTAEQSTALPNGTVSSPTFTRRDLTRTFPNTTEVDVTHTHPASSAHHDGCMRAFVSEALSAGSVEAQTWTVRLRCTESNNNAETSNNLVIYVWRPSTGAKVGTIYDAHDGLTGVDPFSELPVSVGTVSGPISGAAVTVQDGDRIVFEVWHHWQHTMATAYASTLFVGGTDDTVASYIETPQELFTVAHEQTVTDPLGLTDSVAAAVPVERTITDALGLEDSGDATHVGPDPLGLVDSIVVDHDTGGTAHEQTKTDPLGLEDSTAQVTDSERSQSDALGLTDSASYEHGTAGEHTQTITDALGLEDSGEARLQGPDSLGLTDSVSYEFSGGEVVTETDPLGLTDAASRIADYVRLAASGSGGTFGETFGEFFGSGSSADADALGLTDSISVDTSGIIERSQTDPLGLTDSAVQESTSQRDQTESLGLTDSVSYDHQSSGLTIPVVLETQTEDVSDNSITSDSFSPSPDALVVVAVVTGGTAATHTISDTFGAGIGDWTQYTVLNSTTRTSFFVAQASATPGSGTVTITLSASAARKLLAVVETTGHKASPVAQNKTAANDIVTFDATPAVSSLVFALLGGRNATAVGNLTELSVLSAGAAPTWDFNLQYDLDDASATASWTSGATQEAAVALEIAEFVAGDVVQTDGLDLTDSASQQSTAERPHTDSLGLTDSISVEESGAESATVSDNLGITDSLVVESERFIEVTITDSVGLTDEVARAGGFQRDVTDLEGLTDYIVGVDAPFIDEPLFAVRLVDPLTTVVAQNTGITTAVVQNTGVTGVTGNTGVTGATKQGDSVTTASTTQDERTIAAPV